MNWMWMSTRMNTRRTREIKIMSFVSFFLIIYTSNEFINDIVYVLVSVLCGR